MPVTTLPGVRESCNRNNLVPGFSLLGQMGVAVQKERQRSGG